MLVNEYVNLSKQNSNGYLEKYFKTETLQRLKGKGFFCGMDYVSVDKIKPLEYYSRYDHSKTVAHTAWKLSQDLNVALTAAFHDVGTLSFSHVNSFKKGDSLTQENDELDIKSVIARDEELIEYLHEDNINIDDVTDPKKYPLIDKNIPALCLDRADGIMATCLFWTKSHSINEIEALYNMLTYVEKLNGMHANTLNERLRNFNGEIVLNEYYNAATYEEFFKAINTYSKILLSKEDRYLMEVLALALKYYEDIGLITEKDLFELSEQQIIGNIINSKYGEVLKDILLLEEVSYATTTDTGLTIVSKPKVRYATPLWFHAMNVCGIEKLPVELYGDFYRRLSDLSEEIKLTDKPITGNLSNATVKVLSKYKKRI